MEEDDQDEILQGTDDESVSDFEDHCLPIDGKPDEEAYRNTFLNMDHSKLEFIVTKVCLILSTTAILILLPLYEESVNFKGNVYSLMLMTSTISVVVFFSGLLLVKHCSVKYCSLQVKKLPLKFTKLAQLATIYVVSGFCIIYALDRKRVLCHLQDPIKGIILICSLFYYFFFCHKLMGLQRIFSATTIIVGLFISVDYGLCDEFRCRGYEKERQTDDAGPWSWQTHSVWTCVYISGLALFAAYFTLFERHLFTRNALEDQNLNRSVSLLSTVSSSVSSNSHGSLLIRQHSETSQSFKSPSALLLNFWLHLFSTILVLCLFWTSIIPQIGKGSSFTDFIDYTLNGLSCHFKQSDGCKSGPVFSWLFIGFYIIFSMSCVKFLILSQSAVYTCATMAVSSPLIGIWWSLVHLDPNKFDLVTWAPSVTGELICSLLGLPVILIGLYLFCKAHFKDYQWSKLVKISDGHSA